MDSDTLRLIREQLEALLVIIRNAEGQKSCSAFKRNGLTYDQLRALARPPGKKETR